MIGRRVADWIGKPDPPATLTMPAADRAASLSGHRPPAPWVHSTRAARLCLSDGLLTCGLLTYGPQIDHGAAVELDLELETLADLTAVHGPYGAAWIMHTGENRSTMGGS